MGVKEYWRLLLSAALLVCMSAGKKRACEKLLYFVPPPFPSHEKRGCGEKGAGVSLLSVVMLLVFMPTDRESAQGILSFCASVLQYSRTRCGYENKEPAGLPLNGGSFGMHARGSGR